MIGGLNRLAACSSAAAAILYLFGTAPVAAGDLGGTCCVDLEERVAELEATTARKGNRKVSVTLSGQVNTAVMFWDDGIRGNTYGVDNGVTRSALSFDGNAKISADWTAGFTLVIAMTTGARSHQTSQIDDDGGATGDSNSVIELANWYLESKRLGRLSVGRINGASSATTIVDLGGIGVIANAQVGLWNAGMFLTQGAAMASTGGAPAAPTNFVLGTWGALMGGTLVHTSGLNRSNGVRYDTPTVAGFYASTAWGEDEMWDVALRYAGEFAGFRVAAAAAYTKNVCGSNDCNDTAPFAAATGLVKDADIRKWQGSASVLHIASGAFLSGSFVNVSYEGDTAAEAPGGLRRPDTKLWYLAGGVSKNWFGIGATAVYGEYARVNDGATGLTIQGAAVGDGNLLTDSSVKVWGLGVVQNIDAAAMELYVSYRKYSAEVVTAPVGLGGPFVSGDLNDFDVVMGGGRIRF